ncbi:MAG: hypothetical protein RSA90_02185 [Lachnospiraceae bacterium]
MKHLNLSKIIKTFVFIIVGGILGYLYYAKVGCVTGTCGITSSPYFSTIFGMVFGFWLSLFFSQDTHDDGTNKPRHFG